MVWANFASKWFFFFFLRRMKKNLGLESRCSVPVITAMFPFEIQVDPGCKGPFRLLSHAYCSRNCNCSASVCIEGREQRKIFAWEIEITIVLRSKERVKYFRILAKFSRIPSLVYVISIAYCSIDFHTMQLFAIKAIISGFFWTI